MNDGTGKKIQKQAPHVVAYVNAIKELRTIARDNVVGATSRRLCSIADTFERLTVELFESPLHRAYSLMAKGIKTKSIRNYAKNRRISYTTVLGTVQAIRAAGFQVPGTKKERVQAQPSSPGASLTNTGRSNAQRAKESELIVSAAVALLKEQYEWNDLSIRERIRLIQEYARAQRGGVAIHPKTLYKESLKRYWH